MPLSDDVAQITLDDLHQLVADGEQEGVRLELKGDKPTKERLERGICAFANTSGGHFVIGVKGDEHTNQAIEVCGVAADRGLPEQLAQWLKEIRPRVNPAQSPLIDVGNGKVACVFYQPPSTLAPHMVSDWRYYMRAGATNTPMPEEMVSRYYLARQVGDRAALDVLNRDISCDCVKFRRQVWPGRSSGQGLPPIC